MLLPYLLRYLGKKAQENLQKKFNQMNQPPEENTTYNTQKPPKKEKEKVGEYIDYEEIE